jgi:hypothetical protein
VDVGSWPSPILMGVLVAVVLLTAIWVKSRRGQPARGPSNANPSIGRTLRESSSSGDQSIQIDGDEYINWKHGVIIARLNDWIVQDFDEGVVGLGSQT